MTEHTQANRTRAAGAVLSAAAFWIGIPALLCRAAGWPLPRRLPSASELGAVFTGGWMPDDQLVIHVLAVIAWVIWAQIATGTVAELTAIRSGRRGPMLPFSAWCRPIALRLATTIALLTPLAPRPAGAAPVPAPTPVTMTVRAPGGAAALPAATGSAPTPSPEQPVNIYVVRPHDTLWDLAETQLGDPLRWRELFEVNRGRLQPDGRRLEDAGLLRPGWRLELPKLTPSEPATNVRRPEDPDLAVPERCVAEAPCVTAHPPAETTVSLGAEAQVVVPAREAPATTAPQAREAAPGAAGEAVAPTEDASRPRVETVAQIGFPSLTAGVLIGYLAGLRRDRERRRRHRHRYPDPTPRQTAAERRVRAVARPEAPAWVDLALRHLAGSLRQDGAPPPPAILGVRAGELGVEVLISPPWPVAPGRFLPVDDGHTWRLDPALELEELARLTRGLPAYVPAVVTVGGTASGAVLIDLDEAGTLAVEGKADQVTGVLTAMAAELATAPWSENCEVCVIGLGDRLAELERVRILDADHAVTELAGLAGRPGTGGLSAAARGDIPAGLTIAIVAPGALEADEFRALLAAAQPHSGLAVIGGPDPSEGAGGRLRLMGCPDGTAVLYPLGLSVTLAEHSPTAAQLVDLLAATATRSSDRPVQPSPSEGEDRDDRPVAAQATSGDPAEALTGSGASGPDAPVVEVRVLGPVEISWQGKTPKRQVGELVSYLATHPRGVTSDQARLALWPSTTDDDRFGERAPATFWSLTTKARAALGHDRSGTPLILREGNNNLRLSPAVACDWIQFQRLVREAQAEPDAAVTHLSAALALVRGRPFEGSVWSWVEVERVDGSMEAAIVDAAQDLAALALQNGDLDTARFAVNQGLLAVPQAEALLRWAMRAAAAAGDRAGVERAWRDAKRLATDFDPLGDPEPETIELYESLRQPKRDA